MGLDGISKYVPKYVPSGENNLSPLQVGMRIVNEAQFGLNELREMYSAEMEAAGYSYLAGGEYDCQWSVWIYKDYLALAQAQLEYQSNLSIHQLAKDLGLDELPEGAIINPFN